MCIKLAKNAKNYTFRCVENKSRNNMLKMKAESLLFLLKIVKPTVTTKIRLSLVVEN